MPEPLKPEKLGGAVRSMIGFLPKRLLVAVLVSVGFAEVHGVRIAIAGCA